ncbi:MAG: pre-peptidase C-terminal domain-containing protein [Roseiflexaceae bacterium]
MVELRTRLGLVFALLLVVSGATGIGMAAPASATQAETVVPMATAAEDNWTPIVTLPVGSGDGQIGYQLQVEGGIDRGPQALSVAPDGTIYLLDSVQQRVHVIAKRIVRETIALPFTTYPKDILATADGLYILDDDNRVLRVSLAGKPVQEYKLPPGLASHQVYRMVSGPKGKVSLWTANYHVFDLEQLPATVDLEAGAKKKDRHGRGIQSPSGDQWIGEAGDLFSGQLVTSDGKKTVAIHTRGQFGSMRLLGFDRSTSQLYTSVEDLYDKAGRLGVELSMQRYHSNGQLTGAARIPVETFVISPYRPVEVTDNGALYVMVPAKDGTTIYRVELGQTYRSVIPDRSIQPIALPEASNQTSSGQPKIATAAISPAATSSLTRRQVRTQGYAMADTTWTWHTTYDTFHDGRARPADAVKPAQLRGIADGTNTVGIPYTWGGLDSPWSHSDNQPWVNWSSVPNGALQLYYNKNPRENGPLIGQINTTCTTQCYPSGYHIGSAGIDCSGFVYVAAGFTGNPKKSTSSLQADGVDWKGTTTGVPLNIQPMNYFVSSSHTFYYDSQELDGASISTLEATVEGSPQAAKRYNRRWTDIVAGTSSFPFYRSWWSILPGDAPGTPQTTLGAGTLTYGRGQSVWYKFTTTGPRNVLLTNISNGDADLYVYNSSFSLIGSSMAGGSESESVRVNAAGTYYARVYSFVESPGSSGINYTIQVPNPVGAGTYDDQSTFVQYQGAWTHGTGWTRAYAGTESWSNTFGSAIRLTFTGSRITYRYSRSTNRDDTDIYIDGGYLDTVNAAALDPHWQSAQTWSLPAGVHTIEVRALGIGYSDLDAFVVDIPFANTGTYDNTSPQIQYIGTWTHATGWPSAYSGSLSWSKSVQDGFTFTFSGDRIAYVYTLTSNRGKAAIAIDGGIYADIDLYSPSPQWQQCTTFSLSPGIHTINIAVSGRKNPSATDYYVDVDQLLVGGCGGGG